MPRFSLATFRLRRDRRTMLLGGVAAAVVLSGALAFLVFARQEQPVAVASPTPVPEPPASRSARPSASPTASPEPEVATCPLTGLEVPDPALTTREPLLVQVENHPEARPASNLSRADLIVEAPVEGDTTRFSAIYQCQDTEGLTGPIRSARYYSVDLYQMLRVLTVGYGASPGAEQRFAAVQMPYVNGVYGEWPAFFTRTADRAAPHNLYGDIQAVRGALTTDPRLPPLLERATLRPPFTFDPDVSYADAGRAVTNLTIYTVSFWFFGWHYDAATGLYSRSDAGVPIVDAIDGEPLTRRSLVVQIVAQTEVFGDPDPGGFSRREQHLVGSGVGTLYVDGRAIDLRWSRESADDPTTWTFADSGEPLVLPPGEVYWGIIPDTGSIIEE